MLPGTRGAAANHRGDLVAVADVNVNADVILARMMEVVQRLMLSITTTLPMMTAHAVMPHWLMRRVATELMPPRHNRRLNMMMHQRHNRRLGMIRPAWGRVILLIAAQSHRCGA